MAYAFVSSGNAAGSSISVTLTAGQTVLVGANIEFRSNASPLSVSDTLGNTYYAITDIGGLAAGDPYGPQLFKCDIATGGSTTITVARTGLGTLAGIWYGIYTGLASGAEQTRSSVWVDAGGSSATDNISGGALTPTGQPAMVIALVAEQNGVTSPTVGSVGTDRGPLTNWAYTTDNGGFVWDYRVTSTSSTTPKCHTPNPFHGHMVVAAVLSEASGATDTPVNPAAGSLAITGYAPTIAQSNNQAVAPAVGSLAITGYAPTIARTANQAVAPGVGSLTITGYAPTIAQTGGQAVAPGAGGLTFTGYAPTIVQATNVVPGAGSITITGFAPTIAQTANQAVAPGAGGLTFTGYAPTVVQAAPSPNLTPAAGGITITGYAPTVTQTGGMRLPAVNLHGRRQRAARAREEQLVIEAVISLIACEVIDG